MLGVYWILSVQATQRPMSDSGLTWMAARTCANQEGTASPSYMLPCDVHVMCMWRACDVHVTHATYILQASWGSMPLSFHHWHRHQIQQLWALVQAYCYRAEKAELLHICAYIRTHVHTYILNSYALIIFAFLLWIQTHTYEHLALCTAANQ